MKKLKSKIKKIKPEFFKAIKIKSEETKIISEKKLEKLEEKIENEIFEDSISFKNIDKNLNEIQSFQNEIVIDSEKSDKPFYSIETIDYSNNLLNSFEKNTDYAFKQSNLKFIRNEKLFEQNNFMVNPLSGRAQLSQNDNPSTKIIKNSFKNKNKWVPFELENNQYYDKL